MFWWNPTFYIFTLPRKFPSILLSLHGTNPVYLLLLLIFGANGPFCIHNVKKITFTDYIFLIGKQFCTQYFYFISLQHQHYYVIISCAYMKLFETKGTFQKSELAGQTIAGPVILKMK